MTKPFYLILGMMIGFGGCRDVSDDYVYDPPKERGARVSFEPGLLVHDYLELRDSSGTINRIEIGGGAILIQVRFAHYD